MDRRLLWNAVVALVGVIAVGLVAATIRLPSSSGPGSGSEGDTAGVATPVPLDPSREIFPPPPEWLLLALVVVGIVGTLVLFVFRTREAIVITGIVGLVVLVLVLFMAGSDVLSDLFSAPNPENTTLRPTPEPENKSMRLESSSTETESAGTLTLPPVYVVYVLLFAGLVVASILLQRRRSSSRRDDLAIEDEADTSRTGSIGEAAGRAADRIESSAVHVDNEVYRAWHEMTRLLDVPSPETSTPGEFAAAAVAAGIHEDDVGELTDLFEEVRYGDLDPEPREDLAIETLRRIEATYAEGGSDESDRRGSR